MNKERLLQLAHRIENHKELHLPAMNMNSWMEYTKDDESEDFSLCEIAERAGNQDHPWCGTTACIAGHAAIMMKEIDGIKIKNDDLDEFAIGDWLGLDFDTHHELFRGNRLEAEISSQDAAKVIHHLIATGEVDWDIVGAGYNYEQA